MKHRQKFHLKVDKINQDCCFELSWGEGTQTKVNITYPEELTQYYQAWKRAYIRYYRNHFRGRMEEQGSFIPMNFHVQLSESETKLLTKLNDWLRSYQLSEIRTTFAKVIKQWLSQNSLHQIDIFFTCSPELEPLPWEAWELETEIAAPVSIRLIRTPINIRSSHAIKHNQYRRGGARILAIFGDQTGLDFQKDLIALRSLESLAEIKIISWYENKLISAHKTEICEGISAQKGWDILFFAGHSDENAMMRGELAIAPRTSISIRELEPYLKIAQAKGLQFALFNSCSGLDIANALIDLGLNQVVIMREPIQNAVAQLFLEKFLQTLAEEKDVGEALRETCQFLQREKNLNYPSAYLIPSLFGHPSAKLYKIEPFGWKAYCQQWLPNRQQLLVLSCLTLLSLLPSIQQSLLNYRTLIQAIYRDLTHQISQDKIPPILLVSIDQESLNEAKITQFNPLNRQYLAKIIDQLSQLNAQVIGIDYLLDRPQDKNDQILSKSIQKSLKKSGNIFIFAAITEGYGEVGVSTDIVSLSQVMQGTIDSPRHYLLAMPDNCYNSCPFSYLIAVNQALINSKKISGGGDYKTQILDTLHQQKNNNTLHNFLKQVKIHPVTQGSEYFQQKWLQPIVDFSLPPKEVYKLLSAKEIFKHQKPINEQVVLIASGGYAEAGIDGEKDYFDYFLAPHFWQLHEGYDTGKITGGEINAYMIHHWLTQHLVIPIPDIWMILMAAGLGQAIVIQLESSSHPNKRLILKLMSGIFLYVLVILQAYITLKILVPWLLPSLTFWLYILPSLRNTSYEK
jgi:hypothetical protein